MFFSDEVHQYPTIRQLISSIEIELYNQTNRSFQMIDLRKFSTERHAEAHIKVRYVTKQRLFLRELQSKIFPDHYTHLSTLQKFISCLSSLDKPEDAKLHSIHQIYQHIRYTKIMIAEEQRFFSLKGTLEISKYIVISKTNL